VARGEASAGEGPPPGSPFAGLSTLFSPQLALAATTIRPPWCLSVSLSFFSWNWDLNSGLCTCKSRHSTAWATTLVHFALVILQVGVSQTVYPAWPPTAILQISASQVARITVVSHQCLTVCLFLHLPVLPLLLCHIVTQYTRRGTSSLQNHEPQEPLFFL
jgi:hypothetical protein